MLTIKFKQDQTLSPDGVNPKQYKKGEVHTAHTNMERRIFEHMVEIGRAEETLIKKQADASPGRKVSPPKERKTKTQKVKHTPGTSFEITEES